MDIHSNNSICIDKRRSEQYFSGLNHNLFFHRQCLFPFEIIPKDYETMKRLQLRSKEINEELRQYGVECHQKA